MADFVFTIFDLFLLIGGVNAIQHGIVMMLREYRKEAKCKLEVEAEVVELVEEPSSYPGGIQDGWHPVYEYNAGGRVYRHKSGMYYRGDLQPELMSKKTLRVNALNPEMAYVPGDETVKVAWKTILTGVFILAGGIILYYSMFGGG